MKLWRKEAFKANMEETIRQQNNGDCPPNQRIRHQGRRAKVGHIQWAKVPSALFLALMERGAITVKPSLDTTPL